MHPSISEDRQALSFWRAVAITTLVILVLAIGWIAFLQAQLLLYRQDNLVTQTTGQLTVRPGRSRRTVTGVSQVPVETVKIAGRRR